QRYLSDNHFAEHAQAEHRRFPSTLHCKLQTLRGAIAHLDEIWASKASPADAHAALVFCIGHHTQILEQSTLAPEVETQCHARAVAYHLDHLIPAANGTPVDGDHFIAFHQARALRRGARRQRTDDGRNWAGLPRKPERRHEIGIELLSADSAG